VLYRLEPLDEGALATEEAQASASDSSGALCVNAPQTGRFWHRPSPDDDAFCAAVGDGDALIEVEPA